MLGTVSGRGACEGCEKPARDILPTMAEPEILWTPSPERIERATLTRYARWLQETRGLRFDGYSELWRWSVDDVEGFWSSLVTFLDVQFSVPGERVLSGSEMPGTQWFPGSRLSYAEHIFRGKRDSDTRSAACL